MRNQFEQDVQDAIVSSTRAEVRRMKRREIAADVRAMNPDADAAYIRALVDAIVAWASIDPPECEVCAALRNGSA